MRKISFLVLAGILTVSLESCSYMSDFAQKRKEVDEPSTPSPIAEVTTSGKDEKEANKEVFPPEEIPEKAEEVKREENVAGLIPATKPDIRVRSSVRGRQDPFALVALRPQIEIEVTEEELQKPESVSKPDRSEPITPPDNLISTPTMEELEEPPTPDLAENVIISGLVELGDRIRLIVQAPEETSTRYVEVGQYLSNGQVLVKRIEPSFPTPVVVLEQAGIEVTKTIGESAESETSEKEEAMTPFPSSPNSSLSWLSSH